MAKPNAREFITAKLNEKKVVVFSKPFCPFCKKAKDTLNRHVGREIKRDEIEIVELDNNSWSTEVQKALGKMTGRSSVPRVFVNGKFIGGGDETVALHSSGELRQILLR